MSRSARAQERDRDCRRSPTGWLRPQRLGGADHPRARRITRWRSPRAHLSPSPGWLATSCHLHRRPLAEPQRRTSRPGRRLDGSRPMKQVAGGADGAVRPRPGGGSGRSLPSPDGLPAPRGQAWRSRAWSSLAHDAPRWLTRGSLAALPAEAQAAPPGYRRSPERHPSFPWRSSRSNARGGGRTALAPLRVCMRPPTVPSTCRPRRGVRDRPQLVDGFATLRHLSHGAEAEPFMDALRTAPSASSSSARARLARRDGIAMHGWVRAARVAPDPLPYAAIAVYQAIPFVVIR